MEPAGRPGVGFGAILALAGQADSPTGLLREARCRYACSFQASEGNPGN